MRKLDIILVISILFTLIGCDNEQDDGQRAFNSVATITGDKDNGFYCYLDGGGLVISKSSNLEGTKRAYLNFRYLESDWTTSNKTKYINNAHVSVIDEPFTIVKPISL